MAKASEQKVHYWSGQHSSVIKRHGSRTAEACASFLFPYLNKLDPNFSFLDLGCGPGSITTDLAQRYPSAKFLGIDSGDKVIEAAKQFAIDRKTPNAKFLVGDFLSLDGLVEWGSYDVVYCHQVLIHMAKPVEGLKVMKRAAKSPGGLVTAREAFRGGLHYHPSLAPLEKWNTVMMDQIDRNGSDSRTGQKLIRFALDAGWTREQITQTCGSNSINTPEQRKIFGEAAISSLEDPEADTRKRLLTNGAATEAEIQEIIEAYREWMETEDAWTGFANGEIVCTNA